MQLFSCVDCRRLLRPILRKLEPVWPKAIISMWRSGLAIVGVLVAIVTIGYAAETNIHYALVTFNGPVTSLQGGSTGGGAVPRVNCPKPASTTTLTNDGTDWGARINAADRAMFGKSGTIQVNGGGNINTRISISSCHVLSFGAGTWTNSIGGPNGGCYASRNTQCDTIIFADHVTIQGAGPTQTIIKETPDDCGGSCFHDGATAFVIHGPENRQGYDLIIHDLQVSGVGINRAANGASTTILTGLVDGVTIYNLRLVRTHSIGVGLGAHTLNPAIHARNVSFTNSTFILVGGCPDNNLNCGGAVPLGVLEGVGFTITNNNFYDIRGLAFLDIEPEQGSKDVIGGVVIDHNVFDNSATYGYVETGVYGIVSHPNAPYTGSTPYVTVTNNTIIGRWYIDGGGTLRKSGNIAHGIVTQYGFPPANCPVACLPQNWDIENNVIKYAGGWEVGGFNHTVKNNTVILPTGNVIVGTTNSLFSGNIVVTSSREDVYSYFGIEEQKGSDYNTYLNNRTTGICYLNSLLWFCKYSQGPTQPLYLVGQHDVSTGNVMIARPAWCTDHVCGH